MAKNYLSIYVGVIGSAISKALGGWSSSLTTLVIFMVIDYITGIAQAINGRSLKTENGKLNSGVGFKGIFKKIVVLLMVLIGNRIDITFNIGYVKDIIILSYIFNEFISIIENITALGMDKLPIFDKISKLIKKEVEKDERN